MNKIHLFVKKRFLVNRRKRFCGGRKRNGRNFFVVKNRGYAGSKRISYLPLFGALFFAVTGFFVVSVFWMQKKKKDKAQAIKFVGEAKIGGDWSLVDSNGVARTSKDFYGKYAIIYFGFANCPDICPTELKKMAKVIDILDSYFGTESIQPLMITLDPERDTIDVLSKYVKVFHPRLLGLTGTQEQIKNAAQTFRVYHTVVRKKDNKEDYLVDHSAFLFFMDKNGNKGD